MKSHKQIQTNRRYYLHTRLKGMGLRYASRKKTIYAYPGEIEELMENHYIRELVNQHGYGIQTEIE